MNHSLINNFLRCLPEIDDFNYLALHALAADTNGRNFTSAHNELAFYRDSSDYNHDYYNGQERDDNNSSNGDLIIAKATAIVVLFCASTFCGSVPFVLNRFFRWTEGHANERSATVVKCLLYFGGGVLLSTTFLHLLPEVQDVVVQLQNCSVIPKLSFNLPELLMCTGFFLMYFIEEALHTYIHRHMRLMNCDASAAFKRGRSIRNSYLVKGNKKTDEKNIYKDADNDAPELKNNNSTVIDDCNAPSVSGKGVNMSGRPASLSIQNLIVNDLENQQVQHEELRSYETVQKQQNHYKHHGHQHQHGHSHSHFTLYPGGSNEDALASSLRGLFIVLALSLHELFEGIAIGLESSGTDVWFMFGAVSAHKLVLAFCVGVELIVARTRFVLCIVYILTFAVVSPLGIGIGILISHSEDITSPTIASAILQGLACGTLLYVVFFEILSKNHAGLFAFLTLLVGFLVMFGIQQVGKLFFALLFTVS